MMSISFFLNFEYIYHCVTAKYISMWCHDMDTVFTSLNQWPVDSSHKEQVFRALICSMLLDWKSHWTISRDAGDLRCLDAHMTSLKYLHCIYSESMFFLYCTIDTARLFIAGIITVHDDVMTWNHCRLWGKSTLHTGPIMRSFMLYCPRRRSQEGHRNVVSVCPFVLSSICPSRVSDHFLEK